MLGVEIMSLSIVAITPTPETAKALEAEAREGVLRQSDEAIYARYRFGRCGRRAKSEIVFQTGGAGFAADRRDQALAACRIEPVGG